MEKNNTTGYQTTLEELGISNIKLSEGPIIDKTNVLSILAELNGDYYRVSAEDFLGKEYIDRFTAIEDLVDNTITELNNKESEKVLLRMVDKMVQWKYESSPDWIDLFSLKDIQGDAGESAYDIAVKHGYVGTEEEFAYLFMRNTIDADKVLYYDTPLTTVINRLMYKSSIAVTNTMAHEYGDNSPVLVTWECGATFKTQMITYSIYDTRYNSILQRSVELTPSSREYTIDLEDISSPVKIVVIISGVLSTSNKVLETTAELYYGYKLYYLACKESEIDIGDDVPVINHIMEHPDAKSILITGFDRQEITVNADGPYTYIYIAAPNMYGTLGCEINNWVNIFQIVDDSYSVRNQYDKYATYTVYRSANTHLGNTTIALVSV